MSTTVDVTRDWPALLSHLPPDYAEIAKEHNQLLTQYQDIKVSTADDLLRLIFVHVGADLP